MSSCSGCRSQTLALLPVRSAVVRCRVPSLESIAVSPVRGWDAFVHLLRWQRRATGSLGGRQIPGGPWGLL